jgi:hypothetical protein
MPPRYFARTWSARQVGQGNMVSHGRKRPRYRCKICGKTLSAKEGTLFAGLRKPTEVIVLVVTLLAYGCPVQAVVHAFGLDERTVASWRDRAGRHCEQVHHALVEQGKLDLVHVQADEIRVRGRKLIAWMGLALMVPTRLWLAGVVSPTRDRRLSDRLLAPSRGGSVLNTAFIERFNGTMRERLAALTRKCRHATHRLAALHTGMYLLGCTSNFCWPHHELSRSAPDAQTGKRSWEARTPAMASGLTDHVWSVFELMSYRVAPLPWTAPKRRGRPRQRPLPDPMVPKRPRGRPRKMVVGTSTS